MTGAYYNENDPYAAAWLRNLIAAGSIAPGDVDERSILDVSPADLAGYRQCHFFAGIGGWSYALRLAGWPDDREAWTGSCPCQPVSSAGQRRGHADQRHLWPAFQRLIAEHRPATIFGEQVASKDGREWLAGVRADLEAAGYAVGCADLCAASAGAPHIRQRLFWVADAGRAPIRQQPQSERSTAAEKSELRRQEIAERPLGDGATGGMADAGRASDECGMRSRAPLGPHGASEGEAPQRERRGIDARGRGRDGGVADADQGKRGRFSVGEGCECDGPAPRWIEGDGKPQPSGATGGLGDAELPGWPPQQPRHLGETNREADSGRSPAWIGGAVGDFWSDAVWLPCLDGKARRIEPGTFPLAHRVSARVGRLRAYGNAIVPQVAAQFIGAYMPSLVAARRP